MTDAPENADPAALVDGLLRLLDVADGGGDHFAGARKPGGVGRVFGGQVIGQALASAERTVPGDRPVHSLHAYFLRGGDEAFGIDFEVMRDLDGGSFANRRVVASQPGQDGATRPILTMVASFHKREPGVEPLSHTWMRAVAPLPDDPQLHRAVLAYASDMTVLGTATLPHEISWSKGNMMGASLDHAIWFHDDFRADEWLLYVCDSPWAGRARGFNRGRIFTREGRLVANVAQEGLIRPLTRKSEA